MDRQKIIYKNGDPCFGEVVLAPVFQGEFVGRAGLRTSPKGPVFASLNLLANFLLIFSFVGLAFIFTPVFVHEISYRFVNKPQPEVRLHFSDLLNSNQAVASFTAPDPEFSIVIPKISASAKVFPNVSPADEKEYLPILKKGVAHAKGTSLPGERGNIYLFAHSTDLEANVIRYNAVFYNLTKIEEGDQIVIFYRGRLHLYRSTG